jgi:D-alanyl-D-alanine dipeptidase
MPSAYDDMSERSSPDYTGGTPEQRAARDRLRSAMEREGFTIEPNEWWHFNYRDWRTYPILDVPFSAIGPRPSP